MKLNFNDIYFHLNHLLSGKKIKPLGFVYFSSYILIVFCRDPANAYIKCNVLWAVTLPVPELFDIRYSWKHHSEAPTFCIANSCVNCFDNKAFCFFKSSISLGGSGAGFKLSIYSWVADSYHCCFLHQMLLYRRMDY